MKRRTFFSTLAAILVSPVLPVINPKIFWVTQSALPEPELPPHLDLLEQCCHLDPKISIPAQHKLAKILSRPLKI
jgi:hypothetical protein